MSKEDGSIKNPKTDGLVKGSKSHAARVLALQAQRAVVMALPPAEALERILNTPQPAALVHAFPPEDLFLLAHEIGLDDALPLIRLASAHQWEFFTDMEAWCGDRLDLEAASAVFQLFYAADPGRFARWVCDEQRSLFELFLSLTLDMATREHDQDPSSLGEGYDTEDDVFYYRVRSSTVENGESAGNILPWVEFLHALMPRLAALDHDFFTRLLQEAAALILAEAEEEAYRLRNVHLAERGFLPFEEAVALYAPLSQRPGIPRQQSPARAAAPAPDPLLSPAPFYPARLHKASGIFNEALTVIDSDPMRQRLSLELAHLCNRIAAADRRSIKEKEALAAVVRKACGFIGIGMEHMMAEGSPGARTSAADLLGSHSLETIFRVGYGQVLSLKQRLDRWRRDSWFERQGLPLTFWDEHWVGVLGGLLLKHPRYYDEGGSGTRLREFANLSQVQQARQVLADVMAMDGLLARLNLPALPGRGEGRTWKCLLLTLWVRETLGVAGLGDGPIALRHFRTFFSALWEDGAHGRQIKREQKSAMLEWLAGRSQLSLPEVSRLAAAILEALFEELRDEYGVVPVQALDPRYVRHFWLER